MGISFDTPEENLAFAEKEGFPYRLLSDPEKRAGEAYGTISEKYPDYASRHTFLIDPEGKIERIYQVTDVAAHPEEVLADIQSAAARA